MKYEKYKQLTPEQKEEWSFKYKIEFPRITYTFIYVVVIFLLLAVTMSISLVVLKEYIVLEGSTGEPTIDVFNFMGNMLKMGNFLLGVWFISVLLDLGNYFFVKYKERKWLKKILK